jgi:hypothetical protein
VVTVKKVFDIQRISPAEAGDIVARTALAGPLVFDQTPFINFNIRLTYSEVKNALTSQFNEICDWEEIDQLKKSDPDRFERAINPELMLTPENYWAVISSQYFDCVESRL